MISRGYKKGAGQANLRKKEKTNGSKEKIENELISRGYKKGAGQANLRKKEKTNGLVGAK